MDQEVFFDVDNFDRTKVDLNKMPTTVEEYMRQMVVSRENCPVVATANPEDIPLFKKAKQNIVPLDKSIDCVCEFAPGREWNLNKSNYFSWQRSMIEGRNIAKMDTSNLALPGSGDRKEWCRICLVERLESFPIAEEIREQFAHHAGTPPTLSFVMSLSDNQVNCIIPYHIDHVIENGYSKAAFEWLFSLLLVVKKPLLHDVCSSLRDLARRCRIWRSSLGQEDLELIHEYSAIIAIVSCYFGQKDLGD
uniref:Gem-associated protein 2 n=1 Tax=Ditylenchus dipsaci TaxID=166011 RepID=A0A915DKB8_9BILA